MLQSDCFKEYNMTPHKYFKNMDKGFGRENRIHKTYKVTKK